MRKPTIECSNCNQRFEAHYPYCPYCGQQAEDKLTLGVLFHNTIANYFSVDARFFKSFIPLMTKPGYLPKRFVSGQRLLYLHPAQMYLFISVVFFFLLSFISRQQAQSIDTGLKEQFDKVEAVRDSIQEREQDSLKHLQDSIIDANITSPLKKNQKQLGLTDEQIMQVDSSLVEAKKKQDRGMNSSIAGLNFNQTEIDSLLETGATDDDILKHIGMEDDAGAIKKRFYRQALKFYKNKSGGSILQAFYSSIPIAMFILLPIFALILKIFYFNKGRFAYHLVFTFYFFSFLFTVFSLLVALSLLWDEFPSWIIAITMLSTFFYLLIGVKNFYQQGIFLSFIKSSVISFLFLSFVIPSAAVIVGIMAFLFY
ncbi:DUF3667 domain-containing protein [Subsaxibacter sp. CAU 1640]|uniref:DUF3667 domain-containing protein n=1 Tax=Subsaxibacter sp. CAU 1640 TaxID=2933271 RepID=UPI0020045B61|nr:DUF3667 domain-containing protein [Subsaxibacter sp. CAU 1640]MCK7590466.1 DUF3667 domain-containing protein [Subsaxibacter sp. CAU 1640]